MANKCPGTHCPGCGDSGTALAAIAAVVAAGLAVRYVVAPAAAVLVSLFPVIVAVAGLAAAGLVTFIVIQLRNGPGLIHISEPGRVREAPQRPARQVIRGTVVTGREPGSVRPAAALPAPARRALPAGSVRPAAVPGGLRERARVRG